MSVVLQFVVVSAVVARAVVLKGTTVWTTTSEVQVFHNNSGEPNLDPECGLRVHLRDFASAEFCQTFDNLEGTIFVSYTSLYNFLNDAEKAIEVEAIASDRPVLRKRRRTPIPEEQLDTDDESNIMEAEQRAAKRVDRDDSSFKDSSSMTGGNG